ncbi:NAD-dependent dehydratase [Bradyrhizobium nitroreducens]|uniref:GDP-mannose 4,6-dehydratase n=1 Tax=Bradyrhizobium nitroreducens TaxID=709803 RepID=A0A2M6UJX9_9BRAD|nr:MULTISPECIES: GDP-mannose 4,6-dehydratase [Bradyrhizobium]PIT04878.1 NAD-dependent dehydratase [Bradyrhizobium nitroreducens]TQF41815.1 NAD-dependent dehydratase [Bradyrhizobium sp. UNPF46]
MPKKALIFGISGQDGSLLAAHLLKLGYAIHGTSRDKELGIFANLQRLGIRDQVTLHSVDPADFGSVLRVISETTPDEIYNLASQSSVGLSFDQPIQTLESTIFSAHNIVDSVHRLKLSSRVYNACSSECFGNTELPADESTPFGPRSPYGVGKAAAFWTVANYRDAHGLFACSGLLFNHDSPLRPQRFVTRKIVSGAADIAERKTDNLRIGNLNISRDFGWAPEYVEAMAMMLQADAPEDFVIATGQTNTLESFVREAFSYFGLDWQKHIDFDESLLRPIDLKCNSANPAKARRILGWEAKVFMKDVVRLLADGELEYRRAAGARP